MDRAVQLAVTGFFDPATNSISYVVADLASRHCAVIDPLLDLDYAAGRLGHGSADRIIDHIRQHDFSLDWLLETHIHADHLSAAAHIRSVLGGQTAIGGQITQLQQHFAPIFGEGDDFRCDGSQFDRLLHDGDHLQIGHLSLTCWSTPGHTPACMTYLIGDAAFIGDTLFMPDSGSARTDFPGGDARQLYRSIRRILGLPPETRLFLCHDYGGSGRDIAWQSSVADQCADNIHVRDGVTEDAFVTLRQARDQTLTMPRLIVPALQVNMRAGQLPPADQAGRHFLKVPINLL